MNYNVNKKGSILVGSLILMQLSLLVLFYCLYCLKYVVKKQKVEELSCIQIETIQQVKELFIAYDEESKTIEACKHEIELIVDGYFVDVQFSFDQRAYHYWMEYDHFSESILFFEAK